MSIQYRRLAVFVDRPADGRFLWIIIDSDDEPSVWTDLETGDDSFESWIDAHNAGTAALMNYVDDEILGPVNDVGDEQDDPE